MARTEPRRAVFLDRDKTLMEDPGYVSDPGQVRLLGGAAEAVARLRGAGYLVIVVTNQSGIARGKITEAQIAAVHERLRELLRRAGTDLDAIYYCPYLDGPDAVVAQYRRDSDLRKPRPGMLLQAAREMEIDLSRSWMIGDEARDAQAGRAAGCRTILLQRPEDSGSQFDTPVEKSPGNIPGALSVDDSSSPFADFTARGLAEAAEIVLSHQ